MRCGTWLVIASTRSWCSAVMISTFEPTASQSALTFLMASSSVPLGGVRMHQRLTNSPAKPASLTMAPGFSAGAIARPIFLFAPTGAQSTTQSAVSTAFARFFVVTSPSFRASARASVSGAWSATTMRRAARRLRTARASEEPMRPAPMIASSSKTGSSSGGPSRSTILLAHELGERVHDAAVGFLVANREAEAIGQPISAHRAQDEAARTQERIGLGGGCASAVEIEKQKVGRARRGANGQIRNRLAQPWQPAAVVLDRALDMARIRQTRDARGERRPVDVERPADSIDGVDNRLGSVGPAQTQAGEAMDLRERPRHHDVLTARDKLNSRSVVVLADIFRISRVDHQQAIRRQPGLQALDLGERKIRAGRIIGVGEIDDFRPRAHFRQEHVDIRRPLVLVGDDGNPAGGPNRDRIFEEAMLAIEPFLPWPEERVRQQREQFVRAVAADDARRLQAEAVGNRLP